jgi:signal transduction histidine kinase
MDGHGGTLSVNTTKQDSRLVVTITDTGPGIPKEHLSHIFDPFFTTKPHGTGLGLSIVQRIITEHHGTITFDSQLHHGTCCTLAFPLDGATG